MAIIATYKDKNFSVGDTIRVHQKVKEADEKTRIQYFDGMVIAIKGEMERKSITVRRIGAANIGIERIFPLEAPVIEKIETLSKGAVRRAKLYYLRNKSAKETSEIGKRYSRRAKSKTTLALKPKSKRAPKKLKKTR